MSPGERFKAWIDGLAAAWKDRLRGWMASWVMQGANAFLEGNEPEAIDLMRSQLTAIRADPATPPELRDLIDHLTAGKHPLPVLVLILVGAFMFIPTIAGIFRPLGTVWEQKQERLLRTFRLDPLAAITAWRRDPAKYAWVFDDLRDQGWPERSIEALKFYTLYYPAPADLVRWQAREVFEPEMIARYGLDDELGGVERAPFYKAGMTDEQITNYWRAHWEHASWNQVVEMLRRGQMTEADVRDWFRLVEIPPFWRDRLIAVSREVPTRVDVRRFWDMRTIDEPRLREIYTAQGYYGKDLDDYVLWTKVYTAFPELLARYKNGWITLEDVKRELVAVGMSAARADTMIEEKIKKAAPERLVKEKDLTKADIIKGVVKNVITRAEATELLVSIGYSADEARYILAIGAPEDDEEKVKTARELTKGDIAAAVKEQLITPAQAIAKLLVLRYKEPDATFLSRLYAAQIPIAAVEPQRELTKGDITGALKAGIILPAKARGMLTALRYVPADIEFLITANTPALELVRAEELRQVPKTDVMTALNTGAITDAEAISRLVALKYTPTDATFLVALERRVAALKAVTKPREESRADVTTAVKKGLITPEEGYLMLLNLDFAPDAATFILSVHAESSPFSPMNFAEFRDLTQGWRLAVGLEGKPMSEEIKRLGAEVARLAGDVSALEASIKTEQGTLIQEEALPAAATARLKELQGKLYQAQVELQRVRTDYNARVAEWRHAAA